MTGDPPSERKKAAASHDGTPKIHGSAILRNSHVGRYCEISAGVQFLESELGDYSYIERNTEAIYTAIGKFTAIAASARLNALEHPIERVSQHKLTYRPNEYFAHAKLDKAFRERRQAKRVAIGHDVWIGHGAIVMPGISIGHGAVVAAGAVVTRDVAPYEIVAGVPARHLRWRFEETTRHRLLELEWWNWDHAKLGDAVGDMQSLAPEVFIEKYTKR
ncbi:MAG: DapH/DapD/GlmU-related protein [Aestuariivirga sp.]